MAKLTTINKFPDGDITEEYEITSTSITFDFTMHDINATITCKGGLDITILEPDKLNNAKESKGG